MSVHETDDVWRLYRPEWIIVFCVAGSRHGIAECQDHFEARYRGRVHDGDARYVSEGTGGHAVDQLQLRLPNLKGEFKHKPMAEAHAHAQGWEDYRIVARNSRDDHELRQYSVKLLPKATG